ncbi:ATPase [Alteromonas sp. CI.11.F.A3]|uniref:BadF/BadG/BcrA/BcrD ATPase family protein n=1 Tax=Alteromonas sp. CI.11.F.A3 TaxID=3079555 RepID=UPI0029429F60|nr:BadF/BadG/BcrA/BcrD ATPase family protein [Alteromonas sp. CI.11.F.A3]WOI36793.1 ATPase [Alteromonas sp. CI.11.F.A3]
MVDQSYYIGVDGGGTHCRVQLEDEQGNVLSCAEAGSANIMTNAAVAMQSIINASEKAISAISKPISAISKPISAVDKHDSATGERERSAIKLNQIHLAAGLAGANIPSALNEFLRLHHPFKSITVISDLHAACLGAHNGQPGALIICGTGSAATVFSGSSTRTNSHQFNDKGGYGLSISDNASGGWLGLEAVKHCLLVLDELIPQSLLFTSVCDSLAVTNAHELVTKVAGFKGKEFGALAPSVVAAYEKGCPAAKGLIQQGASYLNAVAVTLTGKTIVDKTSREKAFNNQDLPLCLVGGLSHVYQPLISADLQARLIEPKSSPQAGVIQYVKQQAALA